MQALNSSACSRSKVWTPAARRTAARPARIANSGNGATPVTAALAPGAKVRVAVPVKVWHIGKFKEGLELQVGEATCDGRRAVTEQRYWDCAHLQIT